MTQNEAKKLNNGVYRLFWKEGDWSLAAVGRLYDGTVWFAPSNWVSKSVEGITCSEWQMVKSVQQIC